MMMTDPIIADLWAKARTELGTQLAQERVDAVFLEGSIAEGFGNARSDVDFVAIIDDGTDLPTMPYILFIEGRRVEVRLLSSARLRRELKQVKSAVKKGRAAVARLTWNLLERCQRFMGALPIDNPSLIATLQSELGQAALGRAVQLWFDDFARQSARYAVAMLALHQPDYACAWMKTAVFHAAKHYAALHGEHYMSPKWLSLQLERAAVDANLLAALWSYLHAAPDAFAASKLVDDGIVIIGRLGVGDVRNAPEDVLIRARRGVKTWQIGERVHVIHEQDVFALDDEAQKVWRSIVIGAPCTVIADRAGGSVSPARRRQRLAEFSRAGLIALAWRGGGEIRARQRPTSAPISSVPLISTDGALLARESRSGTQLLPMPARRFVEAGLEKVWANIGLENAREDALGALERGQWQVLEYALERMMQTACLVALGAFGVTPQPPLEEATLEAMRLLQLDAALIERIRRVERCAIHSREDATQMLTLADEVGQALRVLGGEPAFPLSFDTAAGWRNTLLAAYDWVNLGAHLDARFPQTAHGGHGTAEEARDLLASCA